MTMEYPYRKEFPEGSRHRIRVEEIMAGRDFERAKQDAPPHADVEDLLRTYILRVFLVFVKEGSELVRTGAWGIVDLESESLEFLRHFALVARDERGYRKDGSRVPEMHSHYYGHLLDDVERAFRKSPLWQNYEQILLETAAARESKLPSVSLPTVPKCWTDIEIFFISDERVEVRVGPRVPQTFNYAEMGFADRRSGKPDQGWTMLRTLARAGGVIPNAARDSKEFMGMGKRIERIRQKLRAHFHVAGDPIQLDPARGYCCQFKIGCAPAFET
jgi:hypothetical protein